MENSKRFELVESQVIEITSWRQFEATVRSARLKGWSFRGQGSDFWQLESSLSRHLSQYGVNRKAWSIQERRILSLFQRKAHLFLNNIPSADDYFHWLGLMQHHGAPTRLIDFTWSPEVAAFFAFEKAQPGTKCAVWAVATPKLWNAIYYFNKQAISAKGLSLRKSENYEKRYLDNKVPFISTDDPFIMNQRIIAQSGTFLVPGTLDMSVEEIVSNIQVDNSYKWIIKFVMEVDVVRTEAMSALYRMNISNATLFPGLDGMARSLAYELESHWAFDTKSFKAKGDYGPEFKELINRQLGDS